jgi:oxygen-independent coproporphyrinogen-3 oxidase
MGYTTTNTRLLIGLGASSISDAWGAFVQNYKKVEDYLLSVEEEIFPFYRGHILNAEDLIMREHILSLMCRFETEWKQEDIFFRSEIIRRLTDMLADGIAEADDRGVRILPEGLPFVRNACMAFDLRLWSERKSGQLFSKTI